MSLNLLIITSKSHIEAILIITMCVFSTLNLRKPTTKPTIMSSCLEFIYRLRVKVIQSMMDNMEKFSDRKLLLIEKNIRFKTRCKLYPVNNTADKEEEEVEGVEEDTGPPPPQFVKPVDNFEIKNSIQNESQLPTLR